MRDETAPRPKVSAAYHHGDLREALILAAREALQTQPPEDVTLKSLASRLGVSQPAPYRHFQNRDALLEAVAADGFARFSAALSEAGNAGRSAMALERLFRAHIDFGLGNIGVYRLMFSRSILNASAPDSQIGRAADASFELLITLLTPRVGAPRAVAAALSAWATLHGVVTLTAEGLLSGPLRQHPIGGDVIDEIIASLAGTGHGLPRSAQPETVAPLPGRES